MNCQHRDPDSGNECERRAGHGGDHCNFVGGAVYHSWRNGDAQRVYSTGPGKPRATKFESGHRICKLGNLDFKGHVDRRLENGMLAVIWDNNATTLVRPNEIVRVHRSRIHNPEISFEDQQLFMDLKVRW